MIDLLITLLLFNTPISQIEFDGNQSVADKVLVKEILSKKGDEYSDVNLTFDIEKIVRLYKSRGFFETEIVPQVVSVNDGIGITFLINEGSRPTVRKISIDGTEEKPIKALIEIKINDFFIKQKIRNTEDNIKDYYKDRGYPYADVSSSIVADSGVLVFTVEKGLLHYVKDVEIKGVKSCKPAVVRREILLKKGDEFSKSKLLRSQRQIYALGFFGTINVEIARSEPDSIDLLFNVRELKSRILNFGVGFSIPLSFLISFGFEELNLFNLGHRIQVQPSFKINIEREWETKLEGRYTIPHVTPLKLTISILPFFWYEEKEEFTRQTRGNEFRISKLITENIQFNIAHQYKFVDLRQKITLPDTIKGITNSITFQLMADYRDEFFNPKSGFYLQPLIEYAGGLFGGANNFVRLEAENRLFIPFLKNTIAQRLKVGVIVPTKGIGAN